MKTPPKVIHQTQKAKELLAMQDQLTDSQWWSVDEMKAWQFDQLNILVKHAIKNVPYYEKLFEKLGFSLDKEINPSAWNQIPLLSRSEVRSLGEQLFAKSYPESLGVSGISSSGGSTGLPVTIKKTELDGFIWDSINLREELWHRDDFLGTIANLRGINSELYSSDNFQLNTIKLAGGIVIKNWGAPTAHVWETGKMGIMQPGRPLSEQADFLMELKPEYLLIKPSHLRLLISYFYENQLKLSSLKSVWTMSEAVDESLRNFCKDTFACTIISNYSSAEVGYIALQCPDSNNFHVMSEVNYVEVINREGKACAAGELGKIVVTPLHNFAMPLFRYEIGDEVEMGQPCSCGRGLPTIKRIIGRLENYLILKNGDKKQLDFSHYRLSAIRSIIEFQLAQISVEKLELRLVISKALSDEELNIINTMMQKSFSKNFEYEIIFCEKIARTMSGKLMQFVSEIKT